LISTQEYCALDNNEIKQNKNAAIGFFILQM